MVCFFFVALLSTVGGVIVTIQAASCTVCWCCKVATSVAVSSLSLPMNLAVASSSVMVTAYFAWKYVLDEAFGPFLCNLVIRLGSFNHFHFIECVHIWGPVCCCCYWGCGTMVKTTKKTSNFKINKNDIFWCIISYFELVMIQY